MILFTFFMYIFSLMCRLLFGIINLAATLLLNIITNVFIWLFNALVSAKSRKCRHNNC